MKKSILKSKNISLSASADVLLRDSSTIDDVVNQGNATKFENLGILSAELDKIKSDLGSKSSEAAAIQNSIDMKTAELNEALAHDESPLGVKYREIAELKTAYINKLNSEVSPLDSKKKALVHLKALYLKQDPDLINYIKTEGKVGLDMSEYQAGKAVLEVKEVSSYFTLNGNIDAWDLAALYPQFKPFLSINFDMLIEASTENVDLYTAFGNALRAGDVQKHTVEEIKASTTTRNVNNFNWLSPEVEDN